MFPKYNFNVLWFESFVKNKDAKDLSESNALFHLNCAF